MFRSLGAVYMVLPCIVHLAKSYGYFSLFSHFYDNFEKMWGSSVEISETSTENMFYHCVDNGSNENLFITSGYL